MNKTLTGIALALVIGAGAGYAAFSMMGQKSSDTTAPAVEAAASVAQESAKVEPAAEKVHAADDPVVAKIDGNPVYRTDVLEFIKTLPAQMQQVPAETIFPMALDQVVSGKIVDAKAKAEGTENDPDVAKRMAEARVQILRAVYAEKAIEKEFSEDKVKKAYDDMVAQMPKTEEVHARHILVDSEAQAKDVIKKLEGGAKFEDLAKEFSKDKSNSATGGDLGYFAQGDMVKEFSDAAFALKKDEFTKTPVKTQFGFHIVQQLDKRERPAPKLEDVKGQIEGQVRRDILTDLVKKWNASAVVEKFDFNGNALPKEGEAAPAAAAPEEAKSAPEAPASAEEKKAE